MENLKTKMAPSSRVQDTYLSDKDAWFKSSWGPQILLEGEYMKVVVISLVGTLVSLLVYFTVPMVSVHNLSLFCGGVNLGILAMGLIQLEEELQNK